MTNRPGDFRAERAEDAYGNAVGAGAAGVDRVLRRVLLLLLALVPLEEFGVEAFHPRRHRAVQKLSNHGRQARVRGCSRQHVSAQRQPPKLRGGFPPNRNTSSMR